MDHIKSILQENRIPFGILYHENPIRTGSLDLNSFFKVILSPFYNILLNYNNLVGGKS